MIRRTRSTDKEVRQELVIKEQEKMIRALTGELMHANLKERSRIIHAVQQLHTVNTDEGAPGDWDAAIEAVLDIINPQEKR